MTTEREASYWQSEMPDQYGTWAWRRYPGGPIFLADHYRIIQRYKNGELHYEGDVTALRAKRRGSKDQGIFVEGKVPGQWMLMRAAPAIYEKFWDCNKPEPTLPWYECELEEATGY